MQSLTIVVDQTSSVWELSEKNSNNFSFMSPKAEEEEVYIVSQNSKQTKKVFDAKQHIFIS